MNMELTTKMTHKEPKSSPGKSMVDGSLFTWKNLTITHTPIDPQLELTLKLKQNYHLNVKAGKSELVNHPSCPISSDTSLTLKKSIPDITPLVLIIDKARPPATSTLALPMEVTT